MSYLRNEYGGKNTIIVRKKSSMRYGTYDYLVKDEYNNSIKICKGWDSKRHKAITTHNYGSADNPENLKRAKRAFYEPTLYFSRSDPKK